MRWSFSLVAAPLCAGWIMGALPAAGGTKVVDIIPFGLGAEVSPNAEPNIAVDPTDNKRILISSFGALTGTPSFDPGSYMMTTDGGLSWAPESIAIVDDTTIKFSATGRLYQTELFDGVNVPRSVPP